MMALVYLDSPGPVPFEQTRGGKWATLLRMATNPKLRRRTKAALNTAAEPRAENFENLVLRHVRYSIARDRTQLCEADWYKAVSLAVRDLTVERMVATQSAFDRAEAKRVYYLSMEFLV